MSQSSKERCEVEGVIIFTPNVTFKSPLFKEETPGFAAPFKSHLTLLMEFNWVQTVRKEEIISLFYQNDKFLWNLAGSQKMLQEICAWPLLPCLPHCAPWQNWNSNLMETTNP